MCAFTCCFSISLLHFEPYPYKKSKNGDVQPQGYRRRRDGEKEAKAMLRFNQSTAMELFVSVSQTLLSLSDHQICQWTTRIYCSLLSQCTEMGSDMQSRSWAVIGLVYVAQLSITNLEKMIPPLSRLHSQN